MSRYTAELPSGRVIAWGYDRPLSEYFFQEYYGKDDNREDPDDEVRFSISSHTTLTPHPDHPGQMDWSNGEILELMENYPQIPEEHKMALTMDLPF